MSYHPSTETVHQENVRKRIEGVLRGAGTNHPEAMAVTIMSIVHEEHPLAAMMRLDHELGLDEGGNG